MSTSKSVQLARKENTTQQGGVFLFSACKASLNLSSELYVRRAQLVGGATRPPPVAGGGRGASGRGRCATQPLRRQGAHRAPQQGRYAELIFANLRHKDKTESCLRNQHCEPKKISVWKTPKPQRFRGFVMPFFKV